MRRVITGQTITAKLKLYVSKEQKNSLDELCFGYRNALNYASKIAFENNKTSSSSKIQKLVYSHIRTEFNIPSQMSCSVCHQVGATYQGLWTKVKDNAKHIKSGYTKKRYKGLDKAPKFISRTATLQYKKDFGFKKEQEVSVQTRDGRIQIRYTGFNKHIELIKQGGRIGASKLYYSKNTKQYYLLVSIEVQTTEQKINTVKSVDLGQRNLAVVHDTNNKINFYKGRKVLHIANKISIQRKQLQKKDTRSATKKLIVLSGRERRFKMDINHTISKNIVTPNSVIGLENLKGIREKTHKRRKGKNASEKQRKANSNNSKWAFGEMTNFIEYKSKLIGSQVIKVDADYTSQMCIKCGHTSKDNRKNGNIIFKCVMCSYTLHSDLLGSRNILLRTISVLQDKTETGLLVKKPNVSDVETKAERLKRFSELRWSSDTSQRALAVGI